MLYVDFSYTEKLCVAGFDDEVSLETVGLEHFEVDLDWLVLLK
jgi:hypothetical protein